MFVVPEAGGRKPENRFEFQIGKKKASVPKLGFIGGEARHLLDQGREYEGSLAAFDDDEAREFYRGLSRDQMQAFDEAWIAASKVSPGESQGSADSFESTAER